MEDKLENAIAIMKRHFEAHPENQVGDVAQIMAVLCQDVTESDDKKYVVEAALEGHPLEEKLEEVLETL